MASRVIVFNRLMVNQAMLGSSAILTLNKVTSPFILISCFGNIYWDSEEIHQNVLLKTKQNVDTLKEFGMVDYLNVFCDDTTPEKLAKIPEEILKTKWKNVKLFDKDNAYDIFNFVLKYRHDVETILVHCDAGISRSSAIALSICEYFHITTEYIHDGIFPNSHILKICKESWKKE